MAAYQRTGLPASGVAAAKSLLRSGQPARAEYLASVLTTSARAGDAFLVLGEAAGRRLDPDASERSYQHALRVYRTSSNDAGVCRAAIGLTGLWFARGELARAMTTSHIAVESATRTGDASLRLYASLWRSDLLRHQGQLVAAEQTLARLPELARTPHEQAWVALKQGILYVELDLDTLARAPLERVLSLAEHTPISADIQTAAHLNLAWIERRAGDLAKARTHVEAAAAEDPDDADVRLNRALIFADENRLDDAARELDLAARTEVSVKESWWIAYNQALIAGRRGRIDDQLQALARSIEGVRTMSSRGGHYAPDIAASHRAPYLQQIGVHARRAEWAPVLQIVMELDALALISTERSPAVQPNRARPTTSDSPFDATKLPAVDQVITAWRGRHLVILAPDEQTLWRIDIRDGQVTGTAVGSSHELALMARRLEADPSDSSAADPLGAALVPANVTDGVVDLLLIGPIARTPLAALTHHGQPIIARAALTRVLSILPRSPRRPASNQSVVLGDPRDDLPHARAEARSVAARLGVTPQLGGAATHIVLDSARGAGLLHVAGHAVRKSEEPWLVLADRDVSPADILARDTAPAVVVLASCGAAVARDEAGWGSLAAAYVTAGSDAVVASSWSVDDAGTLRFVELLYRYPVRTQPARALAQAQRDSRAVLPPQVWAAFTVIAAPPSLSL